MRRLVVLCLLVTGCDLVFGPAPGGPDTPDAENGAPDATLGAFAPPLKISVDVVLVANEYLTDPSLTGDEQKLAFVQSSTSVGDSAEILIAVTASPDGLQWDTATLMPRSVPNRDDTNGKLSEDGSLLYTASSSIIAPFAVMHVYATSTWADVTATEGNGFETPDDERPGTPTADLLHMVIQRKINGGATRLVEYQREPGAPWIELAGTLVNVNAIGSATNPQLTDDGRVLVFAGSTPGEPLLDLYTAKRGALGEPFGAPEKIEGVNSPVTNDGDPWMSGDGHRLWFARANGSLSFDEWGIYFTSRP